MPTYFLSLGSLTLIYCFTLFKKGLYVIRWTPSQMTENTTTKCIKHWAESSNFDSATRAEIQNLIKKENKEELESRFSKELDFGTGGIRAVIAAGLNRINIYTVRKISIGYFSLQNISYLFCSEIFEKPQKVIAQKTNP